MVALMQRYFLTHRRLLILAAHVGIVAAGYRAAFELRFDFDAPARFAEFYWKTLPALLLVRLAVFHRFGLYRGYWQHAGIRDLLDLSLAITVSTLLFAIVLFLSGNARMMPRSVLVMDWGIAIFLAGGIRFAARCLREGQLPLRRGSGPRTLVIGSGAAAEHLLRQCLHDGRQSLNVIGLIDDDPAAQKRALHGVPVLGTTTELCRLVARHDAQLLVIAIASAPGERMRLLVQRCMDTGVPFKIIPSFDELLSGLPLRQLRNVRVEDLLGREAVRLNLGPIEGDLSQRIVLVTGAAGSIGSELARQIARFGPARLVLVEQAESPLYFTHLELTQAHPGLPISPVIADVTDAGRLERIFAHYRPDYVFHAAAYKHVPMMELNVMEAVRNNVVGTLRVASCAARFCAKKFVLISTDKAVNPSSVMGATKRLAERIVLALPSLRDSTTDFRAVRFGNVLGSDGSVVPLFSRQLAAGGPLTVTHPEVRRYFMTIPEAAQLVLEAAALPEAAGRIAMLDMGKPVRILDLAEQMIRLSGQRPYTDVQIAFTGLRPGEKLTEELTSTLESTERTGVEKIRVVRTSETDPAALERGLSGLVLALSSGDEGIVIDCVHELLPEYQPSHQPVAGDDFHRPESAARLVDREMRSPELPSPSLQLPGRPVLTPAANSAPA